MRAIRSNTWGTGGQTETYKPAVLSQNITLKVTHLAEGKRGYFVFLTSWVMLNFKKWKPFPLSVGLHALQIAIVLSTERVVHGFSHSPGSFWGLPHSESKWCSKWHDIIMSFFSRVSVGAVGANSGYDIFLWVQLCSKFNNTWSPWKTSWKKWHLKWTRGIIWS